MKILQSSKQIEIRFSEVDSMGVVWHGVYAKYFEDAREEFGRQYDLGYMLIRRNGCFAPIVELNCKYIKPLFYEMKPVVTVTWRYTEAAKIIFDYEIRNGADGDLCVTGRTVQVFTDTGYNLLWTAPQFYEEWKKRWEV